MATKAEIIAIAESRTPPGGDVRDTILNYAKENNVPLSRVDEVLEIPSGYTAKYAASKESSSSSAGTSPGMTPQQIVAEAQRRTPAGEDYRDTLLNYITENNISFTDADRLLGIPSGTTAQYAASKQPSRGMTPEEIIAEAKRRTPAGGDYRDTILNYILENNISFDDADRLLGIPSGYTAQYAESKQTKAPTPVVGGGVSSGGGGGTVADMSGGLLGVNLGTSGGYTPTAPTAPTGFTRAGDLPGMFSTGFGSPTTPDISELFKAVQDVRNVNQGYMFAPRTDIHGLRAKINADISAADNAASNAANAALAEAQKKRLALLEQAVSGTRSGGGQDDPFNTGQSNALISQEQMAYLDSLTPAERDQRMYDVDNFLKDWMPGTWIEGVLSYPDSLLTTQGSGNNSGYPTVKNPGDYGNDPRGEFGSGITGVP